MVLLGNKMETLDWWHWYVLTESADWDTLHMVQYSMNWYFFRIKKITEGGQGGGLWNDPMFGNNETYLNLPEKNGALWKYLVSQPVLNNFAKIFN